MNEWRQTADPAYYVAGTQNPYVFQTFVLNTSVADPTRVAAAVREAVRSQVPLLPVDPRTVSGLVAGSLTRQRLGRTLMVLFAVVALVLIAVGFYGVMSYASSRRMGEMATRIAIGATPSQLFWMMMNHGRWLAIVGTVIGVAVAYPARRV